MKALTRIIFCLACLQSAHSYALGDLLMSSEQRAKINFMRDKGVPVSEEATPKTDAMQINGFFYKNHDQRENGVVWVNGKQLSGDELEQGMRMKKINESNKTVSVQMEKSGSSMTLKAGQKLMLDDGKIQDAYEP